MDRLSELKLLLDIPQEETERDFILLELLDYAEKYALLYCRRTEADVVLSSVIVRMAAEDYGALGAEGISRRTFSGLSEEYRPSYSAGITAALRARRKPGIPE